MILTADQIGFSRHEAERFERISEGHYVLTVPELNTDLEVDHLRRERHELRAEITVHCGLAGARVIDGILFTASVNLSSLRDRQQLASTLASRTRTRPDDWAAVVDELATRVHQAERVGAGAVNLREVERPSADQYYRVGRLLLPKAHPSLFFGDGDALKTYTGLHVLTELRRAGARVGIADWEMTAADHRERGERLQGAAPDVIYIPCARPLVHEFDRIARLVREHDIEYLLLDSAAPACAGGPENSEAVQEYYRAVRALGIGTLTIAHTNRSEHSDQKPFGSVFWFNLARAIWYVRRAESAAAGAIEIGLYPRKFNLGAPQRPCALRFTFTDDRTFVTVTDIAENESLASRLPLKDRIAHVVRKGPRALTDIASELGDADAETIARTIRRYSGENAKVRLFVRLPDDRIGLLDRRAS